MFLPTFQHVLPWICCQCLIVFQIYVSFNKIQTHQTCFKKLQKTSTENVHPKTSFFKPNVNAFINVFEVDGSSMAASQPVALFLVAFGEKEQLLLIGWNKNGQ